VIQQEREQWGSKLGFILAAAGSAVGLGNLAFFPKSAAESGGGLFLVLYVVAVLVIGVPLMMAELTIGRASQSNAVGSFRKLRPGTPWWLLGMMGVAAGFLILSFYAVIGGWITGYLWEAATGVLTSFQSGAELQAHFAEVTADPVWTVAYYFVFMIATVAIVYGGVGAGIERWSKVLMPLFLILMLVVIVRGLFLPGAFAGLEFLFMPKLEDMNASTVSNALSQAFFSLSLGMGAMITYGSYLNKKQNLQTSSVQIALLDSGIAIMAGMAIFPALFAMTPNMDAGNMEGGLGMLFYTFPQIFLAMFGGNQLLATIFASLFFLLILIAALTSSISLLEVVTAYFVDDQKWARKKAAMVMGFIIFLIGVPSALSPDFQGIIELLTYGYMLPLGGMFISIFVGWFWNRNNVIINATEGARGFRLGNAWLFTLKYVAPFIIGQIILFKLIGDLNSYGVTSIPQDLISNAQLVVNVVNGFLIVVVIIYAITNWLKPAKQLIPDEEA